MGGRMLVGMVMAIALLPSASASAQAADGDYVRGAVNLDSDVNPATITFDATSDPSAPIPPALSTSGPKTGSSTEIRSPA